MFDINSKYYGSPMKTFSFLPGIDILRDDWFHSTIRGTNQSWAYMIAFPGKRQYDDIREWCSSYLNTQAVLFSYIEDSEEEGMDDIDSICLCTEDVNEKGKYMSYLTGFLGISETSIEIV